MCILFRCHAIEAVLTFYVVLQSFLCGSMWGVCEAQLCFKEPGNNCQGDTGETLGRHVPPLLFIFLLRDPSHLSSPSPLPGDQRIHLKEAPHSSLTEPSQQPHRDLIAASQSPHSSEATPLSRFAKENLGGVRRVWESLFFAMVTIIQWKWRRKTCKWTLSCTFWGVPVWRSEILGGTSLDTLTFTFLLSGWHLDTSGKKPPGISEICYLSAEWRSEELLPWLQLISTRGVDMGEFSLKLDSNHQEATNCGAAR